jgi:hypothetical protein
VESVKPEVDVRSGECSGDGVDVAENALRDLWREMKLFESSF